jgi:hypothetical protein
MVTVKKIGENIRITGGTKELREVVANKIIHEFTPKNERMSAEVHFLNELNECVDISDMLNLVDKVNIKDNRG